MSFIKRYFLTGLLVSAPIGATIYITIFIVEFISGLVPDQFNPNNLLPEFIGYKIPGLELLIAFLTFIFLGAIFSTLFGKAILGYFDNLGANTGNNSMAVGGGINAPDSAVPLEIAIANGETFAITHPSDTTRIDGYNCIIIPEAG